MSLELRRLGAKVAGHKTQNKRKISFSYQRFNQDNMRASTLHYKPVLAFADSDSVELPWSCRHSWWQVRCFVTGMIEECNLSYMSMAYTKLSATWIYSYYWSLGLEENLPLCAFPLCKKATSLQGYCPCCWTGLYSACSRSAQEGSGNKVGCQFRIVWYTFISCHQICLGLYNLFSALWHYRAGCG